MKKHCKQCSKYFEKTYHESVKSFEFRRKYCSKQCMDLYRKNKPSASPHTVFQTGHKIYSQIDNRKKRKGAENNKWKGGITPLHEKIRKSSRYLEWRKKVFIRDDYRCQACGKRGGNLHADHVMPFSLYPELRLEVLNGRTLCVPCHRKTDTYGHRISYQLIQSIL